MILNYFSHILLNSIMHNLASTFHCAYSMQPVVHAMGEHVCGQLEPSLQLREEDILNRDSWLWLVPKEESGPGNDESGWKFPSLLPHLMQLYHWFVKGCPSETFIKVLVNFEIIMMSNYDVETAFLGMVILVLSILCRRWMISVWTSCGESKTGFVLINKFHIGICQFCHLATSTY